MIITSKTSRGFFGLRGLVLLALLTWLQPALADDTNSALSNSNQIADLQRSYQQLQDAVERNQRAEEAAAATNSLLLDEHLRAMESALSNERAIQLSTIEHSNRMIIIATATLAALGVFGLLLAAFLQWATVNRLGTAVAGLSAAQPPPRILGGGESHVLEESTHRFLGLIERLERRIHELETSVKSPAISEGMAENGLALGAAAGAGTSAFEIPQASPQDKAGRINLLFSKSQTLLKLEKPEAALACLDELLTLDPDNTHALVKKSAALERLQRFEEAIQCYDRAIAQDNAMTMAYLGKGALYNRMERYTEALACYELALRKPGLDSPAESPSAPPQADR